LADKAGVMQVNVALGGLSDQTVFAAWDLFLLETIKFRAFLYGASNNLANSASLMGQGPDARQLYDGGMTLAEVTARDDLLAEHLNQAPTGSIQEVSIGVTLTDKQRELFSKDSKLGVNTEKK
ncbi:MAG: hypothetical protein AAF830_11495, partial [Pseudomonadota bacterium]